MELQAGEAIRGSDSQLCPKPPPKPSKVPSMKLPRSPRLQRLALVPPTPPPKPQQQQPSPEVNYCELSPCGPPERDSVSGLPPNSSYVERLRTEEARKSHLRAPDTSLSGHTLDRSSYHHAIEALEDSNEEEEGDTMVKLEKAERDKEGERAEEKGKGFRRPVFETSSAFRPGEFESRLLPTENKPLEMSVLKRAKELLLNKDHRTIAKHILQADCQVHSHLPIFSVLNGKLRLIPCKWVFLSEETDSNM